ncbi:non-ribosomal peptide synthetase, partial [Nonomuraea diastatica]
MNIDDLLLRAIEVGVTLRLDGDRLTYDAPGGLPADLRAQLTAHRDELITILRQHTADGYPPLTTADGDTGALSSGQERLWLVEQLTGPNTLHHVHLRLRWRGVLDAGLLTAAAHHLVARHPALRTVFPVVGGTPSAVVLDGDPACLIEVTHVDRPEVAERLLDRQRTTLFDTQAGPLTRLAVVTLDDDEHLLALTQHHLITDGWSAGLLVGELTRTYAALLRGEHPPAPPAGPTYADYVHTERRQRATLEHASRRDWWTRHLTGLTALDLPRDRDRRSDPGNRAGAAHPLRLDPATIARLDDLARRHDTTLYTVLLAAWAVVLHRYCGQDRFGIGTVTDGRDRPELRTLVGFLANTVVLRCDLSGTPTLPELLDRLRAEITGAFTHELPYADVVAATGDRELIQAAFVFENLPAVPTGDVPGLIALTPEGRIDGGADGTAKFDLSLVAGRADGGLTGLLEYATAQFSPMLIAQLADQLVTLLRDIADDPDRPVHDFPLISEHSRAWVLGWGRGTAFSSASISARVHDWVEKTPDTVAVVHGDLAQTYGELGALADRVAAGLQAVGVVAGSRVVVCAERALELPAMLLGVWRAGGTYVPVDPGYPAARIAHVLADSSPAAVLVNTSMGFEVDVPVVTMSDLPETPGLPVEGDAAYVIYTSGSTGVPKGVVVEHRQVSRLFMATGHWFGFDATDTWVLAHSFAFDFSVWEIWGALVHGGRLVVVDEEVVRSPRELAGVVAAEQVTVLCQTPSAFARFEIGASALRWVIFGGEVLQPASLEGWFARHGDSSPRLINMYGITETTVHVTYRPITPADLNATSPIGVPIPDLRVYVLDHHGRLVPPGMAGEVYVGGAGLARGYLGRTGLTASRFVADLFAGDGSRMYRTGDMARWSMSGDLEFVGRNDDQVQVRGYRVELGEIEAALLRVPGVSQAVVNRELVAYYVGDGVDAAGLREHLAAELPGYMVPAAFVALDTLPLTPSGKVDRTALPAPDGDAFARARYEEPQGATEQAIAQIWAELLDVGRVSRFDDFFALGGHSLLAVTVVERLRERGIATDVRTVFSAPTVAGLAEATATGPGDAVVVPVNLIAEDTAVITPDLLPLVELSQGEIDRIVAAVPGGVGNVQDIYPLAPLQEGMLFHHLMAEEADAYVLANLLAVDSRERLDEFLAALQVVVDRHDVLRTSLVWEGVSRPVQVVWWCAPLSVEEVEAAELRGTAKRIDLGAAPLLRVLVAHDVENGRWLLLVLMHHVIDDNTSLQTIVGEVGAIMAGRADELPEPVPYRNVVAQAVLGVSGAEHEVFFTGMLGDVEEPCAPYGVLDVHGDGSGVAQAEITVDDDITARIRDLARRSGVSAAAVFHLAWALVLARLTGRDDVVFGTVLFGRMQGDAGSRRGVGASINTLPVRIDTTGRTVTEGVRAAHETLTGLIRHEHAPLSLAQRCSGVPAGVPLFTSLLNYRHSTLFEADEVGVLPGVEALSSRERTNYPLVVSVDDSGDRLHLTAQAQAPIDPGQVCALLGQALAELTAADRPLAELDVLPEGERLRVLSDFNPQVEVPSPGVATVDAWVWARIEESPDAVAVVHEGRGMTYGELGVLADRVAAGLQSLGVVAGSRVVVCAERALELPAMLLGVWRAGGTYVPVDPGYPAARIAQVLEDAAPVVVLVNGSVTVDVGVPVLHVDDVPERAGEPVEGDAA